MLKIKCREVRVIKKTKLFTFFIKTLNIQSENKYKNYIINLHFIYNSTDTCKTTIVILNLHCKIL